MPKLVPEKLITHTYSDRPEVKVTDIVKRVREYIQGTKFTYDTVDSHGLEDSLVKFVGTIIKQKQRAWFSERELLNLKLQDTQVDATKIFSHVKRIAFMWQQYCEEHLPSDQRRGIKITDAIMSPGMLHFDKWYTTRKIFFDGTSVVEDDLPF